MLKNVSLSLGRGRILGICGPSGSGKSTLARCIACLESWDSGDVIIEGENIRQLAASTTSQSASSSTACLAGLGRFTESELLGFGDGSRTARYPPKDNKGERYHASLAAMERVRLPTALATRNVNALSSGQRQRLALARALIIQPAVLILDETLSGVDVAVQAEIVNLLLDVQSELSISYVFISHNLRLVYHVADQVVVLEAGQTARNSSSGEHGFEGYINWN